MESIKVSQRVSQDGTLRIHISTGAPNQDIEAFVIYQLAHSARSSRPSLEFLYGICADDSILLNKKGLSESLDNNMNGVFD
ncbi:MAG: hypothetical protein F6K11_33405 [Leptolyngbya sp. SIO3F4]|nr:hypothetical protein [Leptolyngbya sp. SIO3F4]